MIPETSAEVDHLRETLVERTPIYQGKLLRVFEDTVRLPDGSPARREVVEHRGAVAVVPVAADGRVVLVRQWRHAVGGAIWEIPAGTRDHEGEPVEATAVRELQEETGYSPTVLTWLGEAGVSPGYSREIVSFFLAEGLAAGPAANAADETLDVGQFTADQIRALVREGRTDAKTLAGLALAGRLPSLVDR